MPSDPNLRPAALVEWRMALDKTSVHCVPRDEIELHICELSCRCRPVLVPAPDHVKDVLQDWIVPAIKHNNAIERALSFGVPDALPLDLDLPTL
tara:strand:- start:2839 stop:3120 length:282 start_codon:yes stop_codon:yes gene_type:complete